MTPLSPAQLYALALACRPEGVSTLVARKATLSRLARLGLCRRPHRHRSRYRVGRLDRAYRTVATAEGRGVVLLLGTLAAVVPS